MFLLDDHLSILQSGRGAEFERLTARIRAHSPDEFFVSIVSFHEQALGWNAFISRARSASSIVHGYRMFGRILSDFKKAQVLPFDEGAAAVFEAMRDQKVRVATMDLRIAAVALSRGLTVLTRNRVDFDKVPNLRSDDWTL